MPLLSSAVGLELGPVSVTVTTRSMLAFAAAIGDTGDTTLDDADDRRFMASPCYVAALEWHLASAIDKSGPLGLSADEALREVHAGQDTQFRRAIRSGDRLQIKGTITGVRSSRAGAIVGSKTEISCTGTGETVATSRLTSIYRGVAVSGGDAALEQATDTVPAPAADGRGSERADIAIPRSFPHIYTECSGIWNPIHSERRIALAAGLPDIIVHGTALWALAGREIVNARAQGDPRRLGRLGGRFAAPVTPGTTLRILHCPSVADAEVIGFAVLNEHGEQAISAGIACLRPPQ